MMADAGHSLHGRRSISMREDLSHPGRPSPAFLRLAQDVQQLENEGVADEDVLAFIRNRFLSDIADHDRACQNPSEN
jgi:hypothetical protein